MKKYATFNVSFKLLLRKKNQILVLIQTYMKFLDLPGGRMEIGEELLPIENLFKREITEELGGNVKYKILGPVMQYRQFNTTTQTYVLVTAYEAEYLSGEIKLSDEHEKYEWVESRKFDFTKVKFNNKESRRAFENYFKNN
jgi:8-oxo-dGTP diphosphatase